MLQSTTMLRALNMSLDSSRTRSRGCLCCHVSLLLCYFEHSVVAQRRACLQQSTAMLEALKMSCNSWHLPHAAGAVHAPRDGTLCAPHIQRQGFCLQIAPLGEWEHGNSTLRCSASQAQH